ncbi:hypothetical protein BKA70DRAFT_1041956, partial [Coprinopsis sp. MPI-PUGE-AT-0042]
TMSHRKTAWSASGSSLPSDRLAPRPPPSRPSSSQSKGKGVITGEKEIKSKEVKELERKIAGLRNASLVDPDMKGGCFCRALVHALSSYTPICRSCGLILCSINDPWHPCPHCLTPLLSPSTRDALITQLSEELAVQVTKEWEEKERKREEARQAAGAFPILGPLSGTSTPPSGAKGGTPKPDPMTPHKVLSLTGTGKRKKAVVATHTPKASAPSSGTSTPRNADGTATPLEEEVYRIPPPPLDPPHSTRAPGKERPFENLLGGGGTYVPPPHVVQEDGGGGQGDGEGEGSRRKKARGR